MTQSSFIVGSHAQTETHAGLFWHSTYWSASGAKLWPQPYKTGIAWWENPLWDQAIQFNNTFKARTPGRQPENQVRHKPLLLMEFNRLPTKSYGTRLFGGGSEVVTHAQPSQKMFGSSCWGALGAQSLIALVDGGPGDSA